MARTTSPTPTPTSPASYLRSYACAQDMNQSAALCLARGQHSRAISILSNALRMWKERDAMEMEEKANLEKEVFIGKQHGPNGPNANGWVHSEIDAEEILSSTNSSKIVGNRAVPFDADCKEDNGEDRSGFMYGYLYQKLIRIPCMSCFGRHNMSSAVALIIIFNLAIAHHIGASRSNSGEKMKRTLKLYQLANDCLYRYTTDTNQSCSILADEMGMLIQLILLNNLSHLHAFMGDREKNQRCIERLVPILMCVVDDKVRNIKCLSSEIRRICLEGFFKNISPLVLTSLCADAA